MGCRGSTASAYLTRTRPYQQETYADDLLCRVGLITTRRIIGQPEPYADDTGPISHARAGLSDCYAWVHSDSLPDLTRPYEFLPRTNLDGGGMRGRPAGSPLHRRPYVWM
jgi:hypothetical protein